MPTNTPRGIPAVPGQPVRVHRRRTKGWRMPPNTRYVGRGSRWGNPWVVGMRPVTSTENGERDRDSPLTAQQAVDMYAHGLDHPETVAEIRRDLAGQNLACWCPLTDADGNPVPCHADVLLAIANQPESDR